MLFGELRFHSGDEITVFLGCDVVYFGRRVDMFQRILLHPSSGMTMAADYPKRMSLIYETA